MVMIGIYLLPFHSLMKIDRRKHVQEKTTLYTQLLPLDRQIKNWTVGTHTANQIAAKDRKDVESGLKITKNNLKKQRKWQQKQVSQSIKIWVKSSASFFAFQAHIFSPIFFPVIRRWSIDGLVFASHGGVISSHRFDFLVDCLKYINETVFQNNEEILQKCSWYCGVMLKLAW